MPSLPAVFLPARPAAVFLFALALAVPAGAQELPDHRPERLAAEDYAAAERQLSQYTSPLAGSTKA